MNIFTISPNPKECTECLDDKRLNKMLVETGQILSVAARKLYPNQYTYAYGLYKDTHINHPCCKWAGENEQNIRWLFSLLVAMGAEWKHRFGKIHKTFADIAYALREFQLLECLQPIEFCNCSMYKELPVFEAYKKTLCDKWNNDKRQPKWTNRNKPEWYH